MKISLKHFLNFGFISELFWYALSLFLSISVALKYIAKSQPVQNISEQQGYYVWGFILLFLLATALLLLILKYVKKPWVMQVLFYLAIFEGLWLFTRAFFNWPDFFIVFCAITLFWLINQNILTHNLVIVFTVSAISVLFGFNLQPSSAAIILILLAIYDYIAVYKTKHMVQMFRGMVESKVHFALIIPHNFKGLFKKTKTVSPATEFMFLGTGDLALPAVFIVTCLKINLLTSLITALGAMCGFILLYIFFIIQKERAPMPGLPPIIFGTLLGYLISFLF